MTTKKVIELLKHLRNELTDVYDYNQLVCCVSDLLSKSRKKFNQADFFDKCHQDKCLIKEEK